MDAFQMKKKTMMTGSLNELSNGLNIYSKAFYLLKFYL